MQEEINMMTDRSVWELVPKPENVKVLGNRWVYTLKRDDKNVVVRYKARLVAQGFRQQKGEHYDEVFSPVVNFSVIRLFFTILVCSLKWNHCQLDVKSAYLYAPLAEKIYMKQPQGFVNRDKPNYVCYLKKALYGLHQSGRSWFYELHTVLENLKFKKLEWVNCVYVFENNVVLLLYVDDIILFGRNSHHIEKVIKLLSSNFDLKILGKTRKLLGVEFEECENKLYIHQHNYIEKICKAYEKFYIPVSSLPIAQGTVLSKQQCPSSADEISEMEKLPYRNIIGCLAYLASRTRPDICYAVNVLSQFQSNPGLIHWNILLRLLGYVNHTKRLKLDLSKIDDLKISCYSDADYASNRDDRISMSGLILFLGEVPILWRTCKQKCVSLSTMESEYIALTEASKELIWIIRILDECKNLNLFNVDLGAKVLYCDNLAAIDFSNSPIENSRTKHIHVKYLFLRNLVFERTFILKYICSKRNLADIFTKALPKVGLKTLIDKIFV